MKEYLKYLFITVFFSYSCSTVIAQIDISNENNLVDKRSLAKWSYTKKDQGSIQNSGEGAFMVSTIQHLDKRYALSTKVPLKPINIRKGEKVLLVFEAKTIEASLETQEAKVLFQLNVSDTSKDRWRQVVSIPGEWKTFYIPIEIQKYVKKSNLELAMQFGFPPQKFQIKNIGLFKFGKEIKLSDLPKTQITYNGIEADAPWRKEANARIDSIRKGNFSIHITQNGKPVENVGIEVKMIRHHFDWGVAVSSKNIMDKEYYQEKIASAFNLAVLTNDLKIKHYDRTRSRENVINTIDQLRSKGVKVKGHVLIWPGFRHLTKEIKKAKNNPDKVKELIHQHMDKILSETNGKIDRWDVVNEAYTNRDLQKITGSEEILYDGFRKLQNEYPDIKRFVNEFGIINRGGLNTIKQEWYYEYIKRIDEHTDGAVDGIGIQSHIGSDLTSPEKVLSILDDYAQLGKSISISEFTMDIQDPLVRQMYTEDFLTLAFSHPSVTEFLFWGMKGDTTDKVDIYNQDWSLGTMGKAYFGLVHGLWKTNISTTTDAQGCVSERGFYGTYEYSYVVNGEIRKGKFKHMPGQETLVKVQL